MFPFLGLRKEKFINVLLADKAYSLVKAAKPNVVLLPQIVQDMPFFTPYMGKRSATTANFLSSILP